MKLKFCFVLFFILSKCNAQGLNHIFLLGNQWLLTEPKGRMLINNSTANYFIEYRKMPFEDTQATICDSSGNFLMSSNGVWIANATNDTMMNGAGLNPGPFVGYFPNALLITNGNIILPYPGQLKLYSLIHQTRDDLFSVWHHILITTIDLNGNNGLGEVITKNDTLIHDTLAWGIAACKHANGSDWWIVAHKDTSSKLYLLLHSINGITSIDTIDLNYFPFALGNATQITFSQDGKKILFTNYDNPLNKNCYMILADFNRCTGSFSNVQTKLLSTGSYLWGCAFSASGNYAYACTNSKIFQIDVNTLTVDTVALYDGFYYPIPQAPTAFGNMYLGANGKIYCVPPGSAQHMHVINQPDSAGIGCDVQQHSIFLNFWNFRSVPNHPNYYLGCDTTLGCGCATSYNQYSLDDSKFNVYPNPNNGSFNIGYKAIATSSLLKVIDVNGKVVYEQYLAPWSNEQNISCKNLHPGIYFLRIESGSNSVSKKVVVIDN